MKNTTTLILFAGLLSLSPLLVLAHGSDEVGRVEVGENVIIVDSIVETLTSGNAQRLNVEVEKQVGASPEAKRVDYTDVWIRITGPNDEFLFSGNIHRTAVGFVTGFSYFFAEPGTHEIALRFLNNGNIVAEGSIPVPIEKGAKKTNNIAKEKHPDIFFVSVVGILGILLGSGLTYSVGRRKISQ